MKYLQKVSCIQLLSFRVIKDCMAIHVEERSTSPTETLKHFYTQNFYRLWKKQIKNKKAT